MQEIELRPLTRRNTRGELYRRSPEVESQIREALLLDRQKLIERANQKNYKSSNYLQEECLVYLIRDFRLRGAGDVADKLTTALIDRCSKKINSTLREFLTREFVDESFEEVINDVMWQIFDTDSDKSNFAETRFWEWLNGRICNVRRKYLVFQKQSSQTINYEDHFKIPQNNIQNEFDIKDALARAREILTPKELQLFVMRYNWEWQIYSKDPAVKTISKHFGVSARAVQNWFDKAEEKLRRNGKKE